MTPEQKEKLNDIVLTLYVAKQDKGPTFLHGDTTSVKGIGTIEHAYEVDREEHLESMIEWAIDQIGQHFDLDGEDE
ncbi:type II toxin-antitoxin system antitoxin, TscA family [Staphylococcus simulans]|uniref:TscA family type II toxin-antitoxin system antitoxin n=1 Tax=Staphylococcus simulans TaxID=1286 RepID=UPI000D1DA8B7|nr:hypothetical protein [Staphylococcus simulans]PTJ09591.1 hypothetical protein BU044_08870 [Staphylococcus simulans]PTJ39485.1 hypothetical protein BU024_00345 [Staphylococcus simulans]